MATKVVCGIDIGSTNTKVVALDLQGQVRFRAAAPTRRQPGGVVDAGSTIEAVEQALTGLADEHLLVVGLCGAGVGEDGLLLDARCRPLVPVLPWFHPDREALLASVPPLGPSDDALPVATDAARTVVGWAWARARLGAATPRSWVALTDWPATYWTGRPFMSDTLAARTAAWAPGPRQWLPDRVSATLGDPRLLPPVVPAGTVIGPVRSRVLAAAGVLSPDAVAVAGGHDHPAGGWLVQQADPHAVVDSMGTAEVVVTQSPTPDLPRAGGIDVGPPVWGSGTTVLAVQELARNVEWAAADPEVAAALRCIVQGELEPTGHAHEALFVPGAAGGGTPRYASDAPSDPRARASTVLGALARGGEDAIRAVARTLPRAPVVYATGGWSRSPGWMSLKEEVTGRGARPIAEPEVTAVAAAALAARGVGWNLPVRNVLSGQP